MSWFAVDDRFHSHRKVAQLRASEHYAPAVALWTLAGSWAAGQEHERWTGRVPLYVLDSFGIASRDALTALVDVGLWTCDGAAITFHEWDTWNGAGALEHRSKEQAAARKRAQRIRDCRAGTHSKDCPRSDEHGDPWECPRRAAAGARHTASRDAGTGRDGPGRAGKGSPRGTTSPDEHAHDSVTPWPAVAPQLRTRGGAQ